MARTSAPVIVFLIDQLEPRLMLNAAYELEVMALRGPAMELADVMKFIVAGDPNGTPTDSPALRVDPNTTSSPYAGVGSVFMETSPGQGYIGSAAPFTSTHIITAGHNVDLNDDGVVDVTPNRFRFVLNFGGNITHQIFAKTIHLNPNYTGFANPAVNDDLAIVELMNPLPAGVPVYPLHTTLFNASSPVTFTAVGYGQSGYGTQSSYSVGAAFDVKRVGGNVADRQRIDDEGSGAVEVFEFDFDGGGFNAWGGGSLGNNIETTLGGGDSGGPSFVNVGGQLRIFGVNTYGFGNIVNGQVRNPPRFGSASGGIVVSAYMDWVNSVLGGGGGENSAPVANDDTANTNKKGTVKINVMANDTDADGDSLSIAATTNPSNGTITVNGDGTITYVRNSGFTGTDTFTYAVTDGTDISSFATVTINVGGGPGGGPGGGNGGGPKPRLDFIGGSLLSVGSLFTARPGSLFADRAIGAGSDTDEEHELI